jgi:spermidine/putrescine transport system permease protein
MIQIPRKPKKIRNQDNHSFLGRFFCVLIAIFLYAPIFVLIIFSFNDSKSRNVWNGFTTRWYTQLFSNASGNTILQSLYVTLTVALISSAFAIVIGTFAAIGIHSMRKRPKAIVLALNNLPVVSPDIITGVSIRMLFVAAFGFLAIFGLKLQLGFATLLLAHITFSIPYVILSVLPKLTQMGKHTYEAALDLGATPIVAFFRVILPEILPGILSGGLIAFTMSIDDFLISYFTAGSAVQTLPMTIYAMTRKRINPEVNALSTLLFVVVMLLLVLINLSQARDLKRQQEHRKVA